MNEELKNEVTPQNNEAADRIRSYDRTEQINNTKNRINAILKPWDNEVFVFDFGHYYHDEALNDNNEPEQHFEFQSVIQGSKKYIETLFPNYEDKQTDYRYFERDIKEACNISKDTPNEIKPDNEKTHITPKKEIVAREPFKTEDWAKALAKNTDIGGCLLVSSIVKGNHQSAVWVVLKKPIRGLNSYDKKVFCYMSCEQCKKKGNGCTKTSSEEKEIKSIFDEINELLSNELVYNTELEIYRQSIRAAISQVFVRNIAHNLVPNVLERLGGVNAFSKDGIERLIKKPNAYISDIRLPMNQHNLQVAHFISYISNRCKYLSKATYGVAKEEKFFLVYGKLFKDLDANRILLNFLSGEDDFKYKVIFRHNGELFKGNNATQMRVSLPEGVLGAQAFYNILENIICNTAKHKTTDGIVEFTVNFIDIPLDKEHPFAGEDKFYRVEIWDNVPITRTDKELKEQIENIKKDNQYASYFGLTKDNEASKTTKGADYIFDSCADNPGEEKIKDAADWLVCKQNIQLNKSVIDPKNHTLRTRSLGLIEMEASAAFLRQEDLPEIESEKYDLKDGKHYNKYDNDDKYYPYFIQAFKHKLDNQEGFSLGYRFYMKKPDNSENKNNKIKKLSGLI